MHPKGGTRREVPFRFRPLMTTVTVRWDSPEAAEVQKLVLSSENGPIAGGFTFDIETDRCTVIPGKIERAACT